MPTILSKLKQKHWLILATAVVLGTLALVFSVSFLTSETKRDSSLTKPSPFDDKIVVIKLSGMIAAAKDDLLILQPNVAEAVRTKLYKTIKDKHVKGILLRIDSPGGTVASSQELSDAVQAVRKAGIPVVASLADLAASGGYYVACACDKIIAEPGTITGSIGVIMKTFNLQGLEQKLGIQPEVVKSGTFKDIGSPYRAITKEERALLSETVMDAYNQFVAAVVSGRKMNNEAVKKVADGRIFLGRQALKAGLIDDLGGYQYSLETLQKISRQRYGHKKELPVDDGGQTGLFSLLAELLEASNRDKHLLQGIVPSSPVNSSYSMPLWMMQ